MLHIVATSNSEENPPYNPYFYLWIITSIMSSLYAYAWDIKIDWGLLDANAGENKFLREETVYTSVVSTALFTICMFLNLIW